MKRVIDMQDDSRGNLYTVHWVLRKKFSKKVSCKLRVEGQDESAR